MQCSKEFKKKVQFGKNLGDIGTLFVSKINSIVFEKEINGTLKKVVWNCTKFPFFLEHCHI